MSVQHNLKYQFETGVYRPPSEGGSDSLLVRFTRNCPWNHCTFCGMYKSEKFELRTLEEIKKDIDTIARLCTDLVELARKSKNERSATHDAAILLIWIFDISGSRTVEIFKFCPFRIMFFAKY